MKNKKVSIEERLESIIWDEGPYPHSVITTKKKILSLIKEVAIEVIGKDGKIEWNMGKAQAKMNTITYALNDFRHRQRQKLSVLLGEDETKDSISH